MIDVPLTQRMMDAPATRAAPGYDTRHDGVAIYLWYGAGEATAVIAFAPIPFTEIDDADLG